ncbi:galectin-5-like isoform X2 [Ornithodoros turicata]|uniref:galectin-5-like isoform X2 n=1 Tax=Ornithodoros turicata TaxID=34597 RepID=UPI003138878F
MASSQVWRDPQPAIGYPLAGSRPLGPLSEKPVVVVVGDSTASASSGYSINLETATGDIAIHVNPRFGQGATAVNDLAGRFWGYERTYPLFIDNLDHYVFKIKADGSKYEEKSGNTAMATRCTSTRIF